MALTTVWHMQGPQGAPPDDKLNQPCGAGGLGVLDGLTCGSGECVYSTGQWAFPALVTISVGDVT